MNLKKAGAQGFGHGFGPGVDVELFVDRADVGAHGVEADAELRGRPGVAVALREEPHQADLQDRKSVV